MRPNSLASMERGGGALAGGGGGRRTGGHMCVGVAYLKGRILEVDSNLAVVKDLGRGHLGFAALHRAVNGIDPQPGRLEVLPGELKHAIGRAHRELVPSLALDPELLVGLLPRDRVLELEFWVTSYAENERATSVGEH